MLANWKSKGKFINVLNKKLFVVDNGNHDINLVVLHGYPTSSFDFYKVLETLSSKYRVVVHDHLGFGFSDKPTNYSYSLIEQADMALALWKKMKLKKVSILAHDYGTSIATEIVARANQKSIDIEIEQLFLCNGSMHIELANLRVIQRLLKNKLTGKIASKLSTAFIFNYNIKKVFFRASKISNEELNAMWQQILHNNGRNVMHLISNYINERYYFWNRWIGALECTNIPTKIVWAENDPVAIKEIALQLKKEIKNSELYWIKNCGHFPMLECSEEFAQHIV